MMKNNMMQKSLYLILLVSISFSTLSALTADELMQIHKVNHTEMNNITTPQAGSLVYNTTENTIYFYTGTAWKRMRSTGTETIIIQGSGTTVTGNGSSASSYVIGI